MKRLISLLLAALMLVPLAVSGSTIDFTEPPTNLVVMYPVFSEAQPDLARIQEAINEITLKEINATVQFEAVGLFSMANVYALKASSQEQMDLIMLMPGDRYLAPFANSKMIRPIDDEVEQWGPTIKSLLGDALNAGRFKGQLYAIPQNRDAYVLGYGFNLSDALAEKHGIDISAIKTLEDLEAAFATIHEKEPDLIVIAPEQSGGTIQLSLIGKQDSLGTTLAALEVGEDGKLKAVLAAERDIYMETARRVRDWYLKGYISKDVTATPESGSQMLWGGKTFSTAAPSVSLAMGGVQSGVSFSAVLINNQLLFTTSDTLLQIWSVPSVSKRPDKAIQFINLAFENAEIANIFQYGFEGQHYELLEDGSAKLTNSAGWTNNWMTLGDFFKKHVRNDSLVSAGMTLPQYYEALEAWNARVETSPAFGFMFDPANVRTEIAACDTVLNEYQRSIGNGTVDPETEVPAMIKRLYDADAQVVIDELQRQLDEWVAAQP